MGQKYHNQGRKSYMCSASIWSIGGLGEQVVGRGGGFRVWGLGYVLVRSSHGGIAEVVVVVSVVVVVW